MSAACIRSTKNTQQYLPANSPSFILNKFAHLLFHLYHQYLPPYNKYQHQQCTTSSHSQSPSSHVSSSSSTSSGPVDPTPSTPNFLFHQPIICLLHRTVPTKIIIIKKITTSHPRCPSYAPSSPSQCKPPVPSMRRSKPSIPTLSRSLGRL